MNNFAAADFEISPNTKVKTLQKEFKANFGITLRIYNGIKFADDDKTLSSFKSSNTKKTGIKVEAKMTIEKVEDLFKDNFGLKVQIADKNDKYLLPKKKLWKNVHEVNMIYRKINNYIFLN